MWSKTAIDLKTVGSIFVSIAYSQGPALCWKEEGRVVKIGTHLEQIAVLCNIHPALCTVHRFDQEALEGES